MDVYTTGKIAKLCGVSPRTVAMWIDHGHLKGWRTPGGGRRVLRAALAKFLKDNGMPFVLPEEVDDGSMAKSVAGGAGSANLHQGVTGAAEGADGG